MSLDESEDSLEEVKRHMAGGVSEDLFDKVARNKYSCPKLSCRKTFNEIEKLFTHALIHSNSKKY